MGADVHRGDLDDLDGLAKAAGDSDGVVHLAFKHDAMRARETSAAPSSRICTPSTRSGTRSSTAASRW
jgi:hypothetical protein